MNSESPEGPHERTVRRCQGQCDPCSGEVWKVRVTDPKPPAFDWGTFWYCEVARRDDEQNGLIVEKV
jgi:hypothetical protein